MVNSIIELIRTNSIVKYILVGGSTYALELLVIYLLKLLGLNDVIAVGIAFWFGLAASFVLQKVIAFSNKDKSARTVTRQAVMYGVLVAVNYAFTLGVVALFSEEFGVFLTRTIALVITTFWNFFLYRNLIFKSAIK